MRVITVLEAYRKHIEERAALGIVPQPLNAEQTAGLIELLKNPPAGEEEFLVDLITTPLFRVKHVNGEIQKDENGVKTGSRDASKMRFRLNLANINIGMTVHLWDKKKK